MKRAAQSHLELLSNDDTTRRVRRCVELTPQLAKENDFCRVTSALLQKPLAESSQQRSENSDPYILLPLRPLQHLLFLMAESDTSNWMRRNSTAALQKLRNGAAPGGQASSTQSASTSTVIISEASLRLCPLLPQQQQGKTPATSSSVMPDTKVQDVIMLLIGSESPVSFLSFRALRKRVWFSLFSASWSSVL